MAKRSACAYTLLGVFGLVGSSFLWTTLHDPRTGQAAAQVVAAVPSVQQDGGNIPNSDGADTGPASAASPTSSDPLGILDNNDPNASVPDDPQVQGPDQATLTVPSVAANDVTVPQDGIYASPPARVEPPSAQRQSLPIATTETAQANVSLTAHELDMYNSHNTLRAQGGLGGLQLDATLEYVARQRALDMATNNYFSHYPPYLQQTRAVVFTMLQNLGYRSNISGENIARNNYADSQSVATAMNAFMASPGHAKNILDGRYKYVGIGVAYAANGMKYYAVVFAG